MRVAHEYGGRAVFRHPEGLRALVMLGLGLALTQTGLPVNSVAHLGGLGAGLVLGILEFKGSAWPFQIRVAAWIGALLLLAALVVAACA